MDAKRKLHQVINSFGKATRIDKEAAERMLQNNNKAKEVSKVLKDKKA